MKYAVGIVGLVALSLGGAYRLGMQDRWFGTQVHIAHVGPDFNAVGSALRRYKIVFGQYPTTEQGIKALVERPTIPPIPANWAAVMRKMPVDPWQNEFQYRKGPAEDPSSFELRSLGPDGVSSDDDISSLDE